MRDSSFTSKLAIGSLPLLLLFFNNCGKGFDAEEVASQNFLLESFCSAEGKLKTQRVPFEVYGGDVIINGDMIVGPSSQIKPGYTLPMDPSIKVYSQGHTGKVFSQALKIGNKKRLWPNGEIPYSIHSSIGQRDPEDVIRIETHVATFNKVLSDNNLNLRFKPREREAGFINFKAMPVPEAGCGLGCTGFFGGEAPISIANRCATQRTVMHEMFHCLGFLHEHQRSDRDTFITISAANENRNGFRKKEGTNFEDIGDYDFASISHYGRGLLEIKPGFNPAIVGGSTLSEGDINAIRSVYADAIKDDPNANPELPISTLIAPVLHIFYRAQKEENGVITPMTIGANWNGAISAEPIKEYRLLRDGVVINVTPAYPSTTDIFNSFDDTTAEQGETYQYSLQVVTDSGKTAQSSYDVTFPLGANSASEIPSLNFRTELKISNLDSDSGELSWGIPADPVDMALLSGYQVLVTDPYKMGSIPILLPKEAGGTFKLENLLPDSEYDVTVSARTIYGLKIRQGRVTFKTTKAGSPMKPEAGEPLGPAPAPAEAEELLCTQG